MDSDMNLRAIQTAYGTQNHPIMIDLCTSKPMVLKNWIVIIFGILLHGLGGIF